MRRLLLATMLLATLLAAPAAASDDKQSGIASWYGSGSGVATQWCTWTLRHAAGCGLLAVQSQQTGIVVIVSVVDWCQCYRGTPDERIVDLQPGVVAALGLDLTQGLYPVTIWIVDSETGMPDTAMSAP
jgi:rare lipoprotein A (peptidoglycan hydrolase)